MIETKRKPSKVDKDLAKVLETIITDSDLYDLSYQFKSKLMSRFTRVCEKCNEEYPLTGFILLSENLISDECIKCLEKSAINLIDYATKYSQQ
jgi:hypothetical protein